MGTSKIKGKNQGKRGGTKDFFPVGRGRERLMDGAKKR